MVSRVVDKQLFSIHLQFIIFNAKSKYLVDFVNV